MIESWGSSNGYLIDGRARSPMFRVQQFVTNATRTPPSRRISARSGRTGRRRPLRFVNDRGMGESIEVGGTFWGSLNYDGVRRWLDERDRGWEIGLVERWMSMDVGRMLGRTLGMQGFLERLLVSWEKKVDKSVRRDLKGKRRGSMGRGKQ